MAKVSLKKKWYKILAPRVFNQIMIGETLSATPDSLVNNHLNVNLMEVSGEPRKQNVNIQFKIVSSDDNSALTQMVGYSMTNSSIKRLVRKGNDRIDDSFVCETSDNIKVRLKPFLLTIANTKRSIRSHLRRKLEELSINEMKKMNYEKFIEGLVSHRFQSMLKSNLKKIYPLRVCEIREMKIEKEKKKVEEEVKKEVKEKVEKEPKAKEKKEVKEEKGIAEKEEIKEDKEIKEKTELKKKEEKQVKEEKGT